MLVRVFQFWRFLCVLYRKQTKQAKAKDRTHQGMICLTKRSRLFTTKSLPWGLQATMLASSSQPLFSISVSMAWRRTGKTGLIIRLWLTLVGSIIIVDLIEEEDFSLVCSKKPTSLFLSFYFCGGFFLWGFVKSVFENCTIWEVCVLLLRSGDTRYPLYSRSGKRRVEGVLKRGAEAAHSSSQ